jgi:hypothetical protein
MSQAIQLESIENKANLDDVSTIDGIIHALYDVISGPPGVPRQWDRDRSLYVPGAAQVSSRKDPQGKRFTLSMDVDGFIEFAEPRLMRGFYEYEVDRVAHKVGNVTHVFSTYETKETPEGPVIGRGINSVTLIYAAERYWIVSIAWDSASEDLAPVKI